MSQTAVKMASLPCRCQKAASTSGHPPPRAAAASGPPRKLRGCPVVARDAPTQTLGQTSRLPVPGASGSEHTPGQTNSPWGKPPEGRETRLPRRRQPADGTPAPHSPAPAPPAALPRRRAPFPSVQPGHREFPGVIRHHFARPDDIQTAPMRPEARPFAPEFPIEHAQAQAESFCGAFSSTAAFTSQARRRRRLFLCPNCSRVLGTTVMSYAV